MADRTDRIPIIRLRDTLIVSVQVDLTDQLVHQLSDDLTREIGATGARGLIIDVSGVALLDSYISRAVRDMGLVAHFMGVRAVICGLAPAVAMTLIEMGMDLKGVHGELNLGEAVDWLRRVTAEEDRRGRAARPAPRRAR